MSQNDKTAQPQSDEIAAACAEAQWREHLKNETRDKRGEAA